MSPPIPTFDPSPSAEVHSALAKAKLDIPALVAKVDRVLAEDLYWFPVRHHSPTIARLLKRCIEDRKPKVIFIEGPVEAQAMIEFLIDRDTRPPVAIYSSYRDDAALANLLLTNPLAQPPKKSVWYPIVSYSPEYVAMCAAKNVGAEPVFIDLPHYAVIHDDPSPADLPTDRSDLDRFARESSLFHLLAKAAGRRTWDETWDTLFESPRPDTDYTAIRREVALFCAAVRATTPPIRLQTDGTLQRERHMWQTIRSTLAGRGLQPSDAMVVCGGFHIFLDQSDPTPPPTIPAGTVSITMAPYSYFRISELSGYGAGNRAPRFYELCFERHSAGDSQLQVVIEHVSEVIKQARSAGDPLSTADGISATQHAMMLARLRGRREPVLDDIRDAVLTCCCKGNPTADAGNLLEAMDEVNIGTKLGRVTDRIGRLPIVADFYEQLRRLDIEEFAAREKVITYTLDKRQPSDAARSAFLHRLIFLGIPVGGVHREQSPFGQSILKEQWRVKWDPKIEPSLIERNLHGDNIEAAATTLLKECLSKSSLEAVEAARQLVQAMDMDLPLLISQAEQSCGQAVDHDVRFGSLAGALSSLLLLERYAIYRNLGRQSLLSIIDRCFDRACFAVPGVASVAEEQWDGVVEGLLALAEPVMQRDDLDADLFAAHVSQAARVSAVPFLRGVFLGVLTEMRRVKPEFIASELAAFARSAPDQQVLAGDFLHGVLKVSKTAIMVGATALVRAVDELLRAAERDTFLTMVPRLRAAFEALHARQRDGVAARVAELYGLEESQSLRKLGTSLGPAKLMAELDAEVDAIVKEWLK